ncbi:hypothetical protein [Cellulosimicrobium sp. NPDC057127]|uniref:hypothetical protein n=1 Tax=Cellulosimicrobium sp. NPDC057127 TaxID=3346026 RepID=UPI003642A1B8
MTTTRRLLAAALLTAALTVPGTAAGAQGTGDPGPSGDGVRVTVEIDERDAPDLPQVAVVTGARALVPGGPLVVRGRGHAPGSGHEVALLAGPVPLGTATAGADGAFELITRLPADTVPGVHRLRVRALATGTEVLSAPFTVVAGPPALPGDGGQPGGPGDDEPEGGSGDGADGAGAGGGTSAGDGTGAGTEAVRSGRPGGLAATGVGLTAAAALAGVAVAAGVALRRRAARPA